MQQPTHGSELLALGNSKIVIGTSNKAVHEWHLFVAVAIKSTVTDFF